MIEVSAEDHKCRTCIHRKIDVERMSDKVSSVSFTVSYCHYKTDLFSEPRFIESHNLDKKPVWCPSTKFFMIAKPEFTLRMRP